MVPGLLLPLLIAASSWLQTGSGAPRAPDAVRPAPDVRDPIFAYLVGLVDGDLYGSIDAGTLEGAVAKTSLKSGLPYQRLRTLTRAIEHPGHTAEVDAVFDRPLVLAIPYKILGYTPGKLRGSQEVGFREWILGTVDLGPTDPGGQTTDVRLSDVHLYAVTQGTLRVDIDGWLSFVARGKLDNTRITGLVLFRWEGERWGLAVGYNDKWEGRSGLLNFREDKIRFPSPPPMKEAAWKMRQILEGLEPSLRPDSLAHRPAGWAGRPE